MYPHIFEGWSLFSPEAPLSDETVVVDAVTRDGRHVDPYNEVGSRVSSLPVEGVPVRLGHDSFWCDYTLRIPDARPVPPGAASSGSCATTSGPGAAGPDRPLRGVRRSGRTARSRASRRADQHPQAALPPLPRERAVKFPRLEKFRRYFVGAVHDGRRAQPGLRPHRAGADPAVRSVAPGPVITLFYSNDGLIPNHMMLWRPPTQWMFSFFFILSRPDEVAVGFALCGLVYLGLLVGWRTRLMQVLALICVLSLHGRVTLLENGGDWMLGELALWTAFLPLGQRFSVDAVRASLRARARDDRGRAGGPQGDGRDGQPWRVVSLAVLALALRSRTPTSSTPFTRADRRGGRGRRCTT